jgi:DNA-directed RNA polymerase II subunit RPB9
MLYPKEDPDTHRLQFACRTCQYSEEAASSCVFRNVLNNAVGETAGVTQDVGSDPTVGLPLCLLCGCLVLCEGRLNRATVDERQQETISAKMHKL